MPVHYKEFQYWTCDECAIETSLQPGMNKEEHNCEKCDKVSLCSKPLATIVRPAASSSSSPRRGANTCPSCSAELDSLNVREDGSYSQYGTVELPCNTNNVQNNIDWGDDYRDSSDTVFICPECEHEDSADSFIVGPEGDAEEETEDKV